MPSTLPPFSCGSAASFSTRFTSIASSTFSLRSLASGKPRSAKTLPLPVSTLIFFLAIAHLVVFVRRLQPLLDERDVRSGRPDAGRRFLLKGMQHVNRLRELNRIHRSVRSAGVILGQFPHARAHSFPWLGARRLLAILNSAQVIADGADHTPREVQQIPLRSTDPMERLLVGGRPWSHYTELGMKGSTPSFNGRDAGTLTAGQSKNRGQTLNQ